MFTMKKLFLALSGILVLTACTTVSPPETPTSTPDLRTPRALTEEALTQIAGDAMETQQARATLEAEATQAAQSAEATEAFEASQVTATADSLAAAEAMATSKAVAANRVATNAAATEQAYLDATAQAQPMSDYLLELQTQGVLLTTTGEYFHLEDFIESWAQIDWYQYYPTSFSPANFVLRADVQWDAGSDTANWFESGCGFVFREHGGFENDHNHYLVFLALDGNAILARSKHSSLSVLQKTYYGKVDVPAGEAQITLIAEDSWITFLVNGKKVIRRQDRTFIEGNLYYTLLSGTNKGMGTHCELTNIDLWEIEKQ